MRVTQHYTNIISQEQIISWKTPEDKLAQAQVNAVLTCKVCDESFGSLKELSYHIVKNAHYKEHLIRSMTEGGHGRRRQTRERRKKSLPVRKLLELERMDPVRDGCGSNSDKGSDKKSAKIGENLGDSGKHSGNNTDSHDSFGLRINANNVSSSGGNSSAINASMITCDECSEKIDAKNFIAHIQVCKSFPSPSGSRSEELRSPASSVTPHDTSSRSPSQASENDKTSTTSMRIKNEDNNNATATSSAAMVKSEDDIGGGVGGEGTSPETSRDETPNESNSGSFLTSLEKLIESFDVKTRRTHTTGILQRLGIDEEVCPPWQNSISSTGEMRKRESRSNKLESDKLRWLYNM